MGKISKATKKFQTKKLDGVLKKRKEHKKAAQKFKSKKPTKNGTADDSTEEAKPKGERNGDLFDSMNVDEFMAGGFEQGIDEPKKSEKKVKSKTTKSDSASEASASDDESDEEAPAATLHADQLKDLSKTDPAFYKFLQDNDAELLNFDNAEEADLQFSDEDDGDAEEMVGGRVGPEVLKLKTVEKWEQQLAEKSLRSLRKIVLAFRAAAHLNEETDKTYRYSIDDPEAFQRLTVLAVVGIPKFLDSYVPIKKSAAGKPKIPTENKKFIKLIPTLKSHFATLLHFLQGLSDADMQKQVLDSSVLLVGYMLTFRKFLKDYMKAVLEIWSTCSSDATRISAFLLIREFLTMGDSGLREAGLKIVYSSFVRESRNINSHTLPLVNLMKNSASDLFGLDYGVSYQLIFGFLRQLAIVLRKSINEKSKDSYKTVYNWQFVNSLDFWSITLSHHAAAPSSSLRPLIYPLVQVTLGAARLIPTAQFFPLRFHLIKSLNRLASSTNTYIPLAPLIFEVLESADMKKKPLPTTVKPMNFDTAIRAKQEYLRTKVYVDQVGDQAIELLLDFYAINSTSVAFPELCIPAIVQIKRYMKKTKNAKIGRALGGVVERLTVNAKYIEGKRQHVHFTPRNLVQLDTFSDNLDIDKTPLGSYVKVQKKMRDEAKALIAESEAREEARKSKKELKGEKEMAALEDSSDEDMEDDDE
ncbi:putative Ribosome assembly protein Noc2 [Taphrina deformans PYCC 5710]|uniref:Ribosome assembly protein Noc2 n=1 Tax=Taphrina deformans (strain PYCC 5710 / ATCC 11124 / CBS 356.35 / IMI 108563 / JCM 9778 / NBRC 8474) TaxID=1097556 RepID=R4XBY0_TAPDE|nr:putative Ribosome assembly protein Noc2 [Taphrina deformans PYCC 5710]|eukprot:CCG83070.1 putative Ribosome assembly protein Noc2 [Taphrina deformans PYCC 5710]